MISYLRRFEAILTQDDEASIVHGVTCTNLVTSTRYPATIRIALLGAGFGEGEPNLEAGLARCGVDLNVSPMFFYDALHGI